MNIILPRPLLRILGALFLLMNNACTAQMPPQTSSDSSTVVSVPALTPSLARPPQPSLNTASLESEWQFWKTYFINTLPSKGIDIQTRTQFAKTVSLYQPALKSQKNQSEFKKFLWEYLDSAVSLERITMGLLKGRANASLLDNIQKQYTVPKEILLAIWGMESNYGQNTGRIPVVDALATLAFLGDRAAFFEGELSAFLTLYQTHELTNLKTLGSWAGGLGQTQFIPSSYLRYAVDFDQNGQRDLFTNADALASAANLLQTMGWHMGEPIIETVQLPTDFDYLKAGSGEAQTRATWLEQGLVSTQQTSTLTANNLQAQLWVPAGQAGPKFLLYPNFYTLKKYNNADSYALGIWLLASRLAGNSAPKWRWPDDAAKLNSNQIQALQTFLQDRGYEVGKIDGRWGAQSQRGLQLYQQTTGQIPDGFLSQSLYDSILAQQNH